MIRYLPPKSSLWGHRTGNMSPAAFRDGVAAFIRQTARAWTTQCSVTVFDGQLPADDASFLASLIESHRFPDDGRMTLSDETFEQCLDWFIPRQALMPYRTDRSLVLSLDRRYHIQGWLFRDAKDQPGGMLTEAYGTIQYLGTMLTFSSVEEYRRVAAAAASTIGIRMSDKHIRPRTAIAADRSAVDSPDKR
jgi:hypothetical protein